MSQQSKLLAPETCRRVPPRRVAVPDKAVLIAVIINMQRIVRRTWEANNDISQD